MKRAGQVVALGLVASLFALLAWQLATNEEEASLTGAAPPFSLPRLDRDGALSLAALRGNAVVLDFWASWFEPCKDEAPELERAWRTYRSRGLVVVGVDAEDLESDARRFVRKHRITYPIVRDGAGDTARAYRVRAYPVTYVIDRRGRVVDRAFVGQIDANDDVAARFDNSIRRALRS